jgi:hypothetical protein
VRLAPVRTKSTDLALGDYTIVALKAESNAVWISERNYEEFLSVLATRPQSVNHFSPCNSEEIPKTADWSSNGSVRRRFGAFVSARSPPASPSSSLPALWGRPSR